MNELIKSPEALKNIRLEQIGPEVLDEDILEEMKRLYRNDAVEAYSKVVEDEPTKESLKGYFEAKAEKLPEVLHDPNQRFWIARQAGRVVGMAGYNVERRLIHSVYISANVRGQGIGSELMRHLAQETENLSGGSPRTILVAHANARAIEFYGRLGLKLGGATKEWKIGEASIPEVELAIGRLI